MNYREELTNANTYKQNYLDGINNLINKKQKDATSVRENYVKDILTDGERYRNDLKKMFGYPLVDYVTQPSVNVISEKLSEEDGYTIFRLQFEIIEGLYLTGLFFKQNSGKKLPLVIVQHGGGGSPEIISRCYSGTSNYNDMLHRVIKHNVHAFAPQLLLWNDTFNVIQDRQQVDAQLKRIGSSITAIEVFGIMRIIDYFETQSYVKNFGMVGLSYGGFYTLLLSAIDTRIKSALSCSFFNTRDENGRSDWSWLNSAFMFDDTEIALLSYPRKLYIAVGDKDELFKVEHGKKSFEKLLKYCKNETDWIKFNVFDGNHEFIKDDTFIENLIADLTK